MHGIIEARHFPSKHTQKPRLMIRPLNSRDAVIVAGIHIAELRTPFAGFTGRRVLACYYRAVSKGQGALGYVWTDEGRTVAGFVCGIGM